MILQLNNLITHISKSIKNSLKTSSKKGLVIGFSGGLNSALLAALCQDEGIPTLVLHYHVDADILYSAEKTLNNKTLNNKIEIIYENKQDIKLLENEHVEIYRYSNLNSHTILAAQKNNYLIASTICRTKAALVRRFIKHTENADIYPFANLYRSELNQLSKYLIKDQSHMPAKGVSELHPDLISHEDRMLLSFDEIEWADNEDSKNQILSYKPLNSYNLWFKYFLRQKEVLSRIQQIEVNTRHKKLDLSFDREYEINAGLIR